MFGNAALEVGARGLNLGWDPWAAVAFAIAVTTAVAFVLGAVASRTTGHLLPHAHAGVRGDRLLRVRPDRRRSPGRVASRSIPRPAFVDSPSSCTTRASCSRRSSTWVFGRWAGPRSGWRSRACATTRAHGLARFQRSAPPDARLHPRRVRRRPGGLLNVWWNGQIDPASISIGPTLILLIIAVIGGIRISRAPGWAHSCTC